MDAAFEKAEALLNSNTRLRRALRVDHPLMYELHQKLYKTGSLSQRDRGNAYRVAKEVRDQELRDLDALDLTGFDYYGNIGDKIEDMDVQLVRYSYWYVDPDNWKSKIRMYTFINDLGNVFLWGTPARMFRQPRANYKITGKNLLGSRFRISAKIKNHQEFCGINQTVISYTKWELL